MQITLVHIGPRGVSKDGYEALVQAYLARCAAFVRCATESFRDEAALLEWLARQRGRTPVVAVFLDSRGKQMDSESFAAWFGKQRDGGTQHLVFAIGPADGWSEAGRKQAQMLLSFGLITMAHSLARLVLAEQLYRACTILTGHPYHGGH